MITTTARMSLAMAASLLLTIVSRAGEPVYPVKVSENGRYFIDQKGDPVFWLGTTQWQLFREYSREDARTILEKSKDKGFAFVQVMLMGVGDGTKPNIHGAKPWINDNPLTPNEAYFKNVDTVVEIAREKNLVISMTMFHQRYRKYITVDNARAWAKWVAARYKDVPTIVWSMTPEAKPEFVPILRRTGRRPARGRRRYSSDHVQARSRPLFLEFHPWRDVARLRLDADLEKRRADLSHGDQGLQSQTHKTGPHGRGRLRTRLRVRVRRHSALGSQAGLLFLPGGRSSHLRTQ